MNILKKIFSFYINSSLHVALAVCAFTMITTVEFELELSKTMIVFVFFGTVFGYSFIKKNDSGNIFNLVLKSRNILLVGILILLFVITVYCMYQLTFQAVYVTIIFALLTLLYAIPFLKNKSLRHFNGLKIFIVAFVWAGVTVFIPYLNEFNATTDDVNVTFFQRFLMVLVLILPFEFRDLSVDASYLRTLPQRLGVLQTKGVGVVLIGVCFLLEFLKDTIQLTNLYSLSFTLFLLLIFLIFAQKKQSKYYASFWVESIPIVWLGLILIFERII